MNILVVTACMSRKAGGPFISVRSLSKELSKTCRLTVFSLADEFSDIDRRSWLPLEPVSFARWGPRSIGFSPALKRSIDQADVDIIHSHGMWMYPSIAARLVARRRRIPFIVSPRGMLDPWALQISQWKKKVVGRLVEDENLRSASCIHALCESEYQSIRAYGLKNPVAVIPNGMNLPDAEPMLPAPWSHEIDATRRVVLFLGRIHPKKGLVSLIQAWARLKQESGRMLSQWALVIAGWSQRGHEEELKGKVGETGLAHDVIFLGPVFDDRKKACFQNATAFILPSLSEGLPMSVLEAWSYRLPVLMTRACNIPEGFRANAALEIEANERSIAEGLRRFIQFPPTMKRKFGENGREVVKRSFSWERIGNEMLSVYKWIVARGDKPACVTLR